MIRPITVLIVDDHPLVREGLIAKFEWVHDIKVVADACDADQALDLVARYKPDVVLTDISLPDRNGIELTSELVARDAKLPVVILSVHQTSEYLRLAMNAGARGYVPKSAPTTEILLAIRSVTNGGTYVSATLGAGLFQKLRRRPLLSEREEQVLALIAQGLSSKHIARALDIGIRTVESHRHSIRRKLALQGPGDLIRYAVEHARDGLAQTPPRGSASMTAAILEGGKLRLSGARLR